MSNTRQGLCSRKTDLPFGAKYPLATMFEIMNKVVGDLSYPMESANDNTGFSTTADEQLAIFKRGF